MNQLNLQYDPPIQIDVDKIIDENMGIEYLGKATKQITGDYTCLANVRGMLCLVKVKIKEKQ
jgi:hypothetical protein